ncbi:hypothetical protein R6242_16180 [Iodobacter sp. CM08]|uniref:hypothetical protein n=1 Tax=Iodobacter sp. CM08 TaxID=3085902 RepID=UPI0029812F49|nr:hypothetical protein [Iodobacter sp. CM08]MDW5418105.1 hypothetical protein [Iodobacter sp. CM08]
MTKKLTKAQCEARYEAYSEAANHLKQYSALNERHSMKEISEVAGEVQNQYVLQDSRNLCGGNMMFWKMGGDYTTNIAQAEVFSEAEALSQHNMRNTDIPLPKVAVLTLSRPTVDVQYLNESEAALISDELFYVQVNNRFDGNDAYWVTKPSKSTTDIGQAVLYVKDDPSVGENVKFWPQSYIQTKTRSSVAAKSLDIHKAFEGTAIQINKPKKRKIPLHCNGCGSFISAANYYAGSCQKCGTENRS